MFNNSMGRPWGHRIQGDQQGPSATGPVITRQLCRKLNWWQQQPLATAAMPGDGQQQRLEKQQYFNKFFKCHLHLP